MSRETIQVPVVYRKEKYYFYLAALWEDEEMEIRVQLRELDKDDPHYRQNFFNAVVDVFKANAVELPVIVKDAEGKKPKEPLFTEAISVTEAVEQFFNELTLRTQRISSGLLNNYLVAQTQDVDF